MATVAQRSGVGRRHRRPPAAVAPGDVGHTGRSLPLPTAARWSRWAVLVTVITAGGLMPWLAELPAPVMLAVAGAGLVAGVPHGALDHVIATHLAGGSLMLASGAYAAVAASSWTLLAVAGPSALLAVIALSAVHFGLGELEVYRRLTGWCPSRLTRFALGVAGCGALLLPLARSGDQIESVARAVSPEIGLIIGAEPVRLGVALSWLIAAVIGVWAALRAGHRAPAVDIVLTGLLGALAPPLVAFAVWFGAWHSLRHGARILTTEPGCARFIAAGQLRAATKRLVRMSVWPSVAALGGLAAAGWVTALAPDPAVMVAEVLRMLLALTVPHMVVVWWLDLVSEP